MDSPKNSVEKKVPTPFWVDRTLWDGLGFPRVSCRGVDGSRFPWSYTEGPRVHWSEFKCLRASKKVGKDSRALNTDSEVLQTSLAVGKCSEVSGIREGCRFCTEGGRYSKQSWEVVEVSVTPLLEDCISRMLWVNGGVSSVLSSESKSPSIPGSDDECPKDTKSKKGPEASWDDKEVSGAP